MNLNAKIIFFQKDGPDFFPIESKNGILWEKRTQNFQLIEVTSILGFLQKEFFLYLGSLGTGKYVGTFLPYYLYISYD